WSSDVCSSDLGCKERDSAGSLGAKPADWFEFGDLGPHGVDNAPSSKVGAKTHGKIRSQDDGPMKTSPGCRKVMTRHDSRRVQCAGDDSHRLLRVVAAMAEAV